MYERQRKPLLNGLQINYFQRAKSTYRATASLDIDGYGTVERTVDEKVRPR